MPERHGHEPIASATEHIVRDIIGAAIEVHRELGPGFIESVYGGAMLIELRHRHLLTEAEKAIQIQYRGELVCSHRLDIVVERLVVVEVKAAASRCRVGLLMNFNVPVLVDGLHRFVL